MTEVADRGSSEAEVELERYRGELTGYCYRMLGSGFEAEDAVQDTFVRAWRSYDTFEGRSSLRSWLYRIATNVCFDLLEGRNRRALPMDLTGPRSVDAGLPEPLPESAWLQPVPDQRVLPAQSDPAAAAELKETIRLAFIASLQLLPPRQRAVLILREVLQWPASDVAELLGSSVAAVNSALQRARATLESTDATSSDPAPPMDQRTQDLLDRYVDAFERYDMPALTALLREDATWSMPPYDLWLQTHEDIVRFNTTIGAACEGSKLIPTMANGQPAFAQYKPDPVDGGLAPWSLQVLDIRDGQIAGVIFFLDTERIFPLFGVPPRL